MVNLVDLLLRLAAQCFAHVPDQPARVGLFFPAEQEDGRVRGFPLASPGE